MNQISVLAAMQDVLAEAKDLATREFSRLVRDNVVKCVLADIDRIIALDFSGIDIVDYSGSDEVVVVLLKRIISGELSGRFLLLMNLRAVHRENIAVALEYKNQKLAVIEKRSDSVTILGNLKPMLREALRRVHNEGIRTARQLADVSGSEINLAGTKLLQLYQLGLLVREEEQLTEGGRQFVYKPLIELPMT